MAEESKRVRPHTRSHSALFISTGTVALALSTLLLLAGARHTAGADGDKEPPQPPGKVGSPARTVEQAIDAGLGWLARHQDEDGGWKGKGFTKLCKKTCENSKSLIAGDGRGWEYFDIGVTGLALLSFAEAGYTHKKGKNADFVAAVHKGVEYLKSKQVTEGDAKSKGRFGSDEHEQWIYNHAIATLALATLLKSSSDADGLRTVVRQSALLSLEARNSGMAWKYGMQSGQNDTSVTSWMVAAIRACERCELGIASERYRSAYQGARSWIDRMMSSKSGKIGYESPGDPGASLQGVFPEPYPFSKKITCMTAAGIHARLQSGESPTSEKIKRGLGAITTVLPTWTESDSESKSTINFLYWYYGSKVLRQVGGDDSKKWSEKLDAALLPNQRTGGDEDGSWDPIDEWGNPGGRVYSTAMGILALHACHSGDGKK